MFKLTRTQLLNIVRIWIPLAITITGLCGLVYLVAQQNIRIGANDPQIQISEDVARQIETGQNPLDFIPPIKVDISKSLAGYIIVFDEKGKLIGSSAVLNGKDPIVPQGIFTDTKKLGETRFTWQPQVGVRSAVVVNYYKGLATSGYVLVGRSMKEVEKREDNLGLIILLAWIIILGASLTSALILQKIK
jgi:hypothetical protein